jgi:hypothetical protein
MSGEDLSLEGRDLAPATVDREFGLAYAAAPGFEKRAIEYLERAPQDDAEVLAHLIYMSRVERRLSSIRLKWPRR